MVAMQEKLLQWKIYSLWWGTLCLSRTPKGGTKRDAIFLHTNVRFKLKSGRIRKNGSILIKCYVLCGYF